MRYLQDTTLHRGWVALWLFVLGATLGTMLDALHVYTGVERYPMPVLFGAAAIAIGYSRPLADSLLQHRRPTRRLSISLGELTWLLFAYLIATSMLESVAKVGILSIIYLNFWLLAGRSWQNLLLALVTAVTGTLIEMILVAAGIFCYIHPDIFGVPYWLPCIYACASLAVGDLGRSLISLHTRAAL